MLTFIGLGLYDERSITVEGREALADADRAFAEFYTSHLVGATVEDLESYHDIDVAVRDRAGVEQHPEDILDAAEDEHVVFLTAGDTMISTTHVDLRLRAVERGIDTRVIHGVTAQSAASGLTGLQNYRFGKAVTLPFPYAHGADGVPKSVIDSIEANRERGLHTLVYLDIKADRDEYMSGDYAAEMLADGWEDVLGIVVARAGSEDPLVAADRLSELAERDFGDPLHMLVIPGDVHHVEADALRTLGGAPDEVLSENEV
ncbi:diphthine synthase [Halogeometricum borinquense DSM 11551]|uniref:Diphthine synthase n=1 Tax=Halogeometricum borinquense (strain ATCC 700274 / DSM 11551 / JCM 10706 / KCTC 4070 / PR3) TaxID=469382 RepID=E4NQS1_HALBP|nr:diphthine synthase [Halogeometricum borinquense]ADQ67868.1 diphthine synthase [Halogeometricum borinquense DSM 11551]ELY23450.1 diphthine synthase [Halogeometricum borinquense DSM 11551]